MTRDRHRGGGARGTGAPRSGPGERSVYGVGPVREVIARRPQSVRVLWVDPQRAGKSAGDPVAQIVNIRFHSLVHGRRHGSSDRVRPRAPGL